jgi:hypothetical protein
LKQGGWRRSAAAIVEELFPAVHRCHWDALLDLRGLLLSGNDWTQALALFAECRAELELDHYLPFYRLRQLLVASLRVEGAEERAVHALLQPAHLRPSPEAPAPLRVVETT